MPSPTGHPRTTNISLLPKTPQPTQLHPLPPPPHRRHSARKLDTRCYKRIGAGPPCTIHGVRPARSRALARAARSLTSSDSHTPLRMAGSGRWRTSGTPCAVPSLRYHRINGLAASRRGMEICPVLSQAPAYFLFPASIQLRNARTKSIPIAIFQLSRLLAGIESNFVEGSVRSTLPAGRLRSSAS